MPGAAAKGQTSHPMAGPSGSTDNFDAAVRPYLEAWGKHAHSPLPAFALSGLFALSAPLSVVISVPTPSPVAPVGQGSASATIASAATSSAAATSRPYPGAGIVAAARAPIAALPPFYQLVGFSAVFAGGGYIVRQGDTLNGSGVMTAWSGLFLFFRLAPSFSLKAPGQPLPLLLSTSTLAAGSVYAAHYFSRTMFRKWEDFKPPPSTRWKSPTNGVVGHALQPPPQDLSTALSQKFSQQVPDRSLPSW